MSRPTDDGPFDGPDAAPGTGSPGGAADSAGRPWAGRSFEPNPHAADDGSAPPELAAAVRRFRSGDGGQADVVQAFGGSRLLIPLLAELGDGGTAVGEHGLAVDKSQELSIVTVAGPDGRRVLPVFASVGAMSTWNPTARPVPADGVRVALAAADDGTDLVVLDPGSDGEFVLRRPAVWAVAQSRPWRPPFEDDAVIAAFERSISSELAVLGVELLPGDPDARLAGPELVVRLQLVAGLTREELDATTTRLARRWAEDDVIAAGVDSLAVKLVGGASAP
ncbi:SseB family protein [Agromyces sp. G08B096]|uniref:SseB family protein n=1 Tax=Agromyces sp. G08B096 TaxID=3156399 RepID=A0AAU7W3B4_9MICO